MYSIGFSIGFSVKLAVVVFSGFVFHVACHDSHRQCFDVESKTICYFMPNVSLVDWATAWTTCRELDAILPVILNEKGQKEIEKYLSQHLPVQPAWTAGRYVGSNSTWRWVTGQDFNGADKPSCPGNARYCDHEIQGILTKDMRYGARYPTNTHQFICSFPGVSCTTESQNSITWKGGCLNWTRKNHSLHLNKARNECLKGGGDLATFSEDGDLQHLQRVTSLQKDSGTNGYLIGLHRKWWIWNTTGTYIHDMKFNLLNNYSDFGKDCLSIESRSKWNRDECHVKRHVICQIETRTLNSVDPHITETMKPSSADEPSTSSVVIGVVATILAVAICAVVLLIFIKKRKRHSETKPDAGTSISMPCPVTPSQNTITQYPDSTYETIDFDDDMENLNEANSSYTHLDFRNNPSGVYSELANSTASEANRSPALYLEL